MFTIFDVIDYQEKVNSIAKARGRAKERGLTECTGCGGCCARMPCVPTPDEVRLIAKYLGLSLEECVWNYFTVYWMPKRGAYLLPIKTSWQNYSGLLIDSAATFNLGYCIFYDEDNRLCKIEPVKPRVGREFGCWKEFNEEIAEETYKLWQGIDLESFGARPPFAPVFHSTEEQGEG